MLRTHEPVLSRLSKRKVANLLACAKMLLKYFPLYLLLACFSKGQFFFRQENQRLAKSLENDRPCRFLLGSEDPQITTPKVIEKYGYPSERHWTTTEDGYILELHRIPAPGKHVVFLLHGIFGSSRDFVVNCNRRALAFKLHEAGYDVWLGNYRGNTYCRNHTTLKDRDPKFWKFSVDEVSYYDGPAMIDYALNATGKKHLSFIGHSMGNGIALGMLTTRPEYNQKVNVWFVLAAAVDVQDTRSTPLRLLAPFYRQLEWLLAHFNRGEVLPTSVVWFIRNIWTRVCMLEGRRQDPHGICAILLYTFDGYDPGQIRPEFMSIIVGGAPTTMSARFFTQWLQWVINGRFALFDEGPLRNLRKYGDVKPTLYPLKNLATDVYLFWGPNDWVITKESVEKTVPLIAELGERRDRVHFIRVNFTQFNHLDFIHGKDADIYVYKPLMAILEGYRDDDEDAEMATITEVGSNAIIEGSLED